MQLHVKINRKPAFTSVQCFLTSLWESWIHTPMPSWLQQRNLDPSRHAILAACTCTKQWPQLLFSLCPRWGVVCITCLSHAYVRLVHVMKTGIKMAVVECQWTWSRGWPSKPCISCSSRRKWYWAFRSLKGFLNEDFSVGRRACKPRIK